MESSPLNDWIARKTTRPLADEIYQFVADLEGDKDRLPLVFYWVLVNEFRFRTHSTRRIRRYLSLLIEEGRLYQDDPYSANPLISTKPFREES